MTRWSLRINPPVPIILYYLVTEWNVLLFRRLSGTAEKIICVWLIVHSCCFLSYLWHVNKVEYPNALTLLLFILFFFRSHNNDQGIAEPRTILFVACLKCSLGLAMWLFQQLWKRCLSCMHNYCDLRMFHSAIIFVVAVKCKLGQAPFLRLRAAQKLACIRSNNVTQRKMPP